MDHFAHECGEPKKVAHISIFLSSVCILSTILLTNSYPLWIIDSEATDRVIGD